MLRQKPEDIFILTNTLLQGGAEKQSVLLAKNLGRFYTTTLIVYYGNQLDNRLMELVDQNQIRVILLQGNLFQKIEQLFALFKTSKCSIVISYLATTNFINAVIGKIMGIEYRIGGIRSSRLTPIKMRMQRFLHNKLLSHSVCNNIEALNYMEQNGFNVKKTTVIHNCIEVKESIRKGKSVSSKINILTVGRFVLEKDYDTALKSFELLLQKSAKYSLDINFVIVGYGEQEIYIRHLIDELELNKKVSIFINPPNIRDFYRNSNIYLSTSLFEGLSNSIMEAMEFSLPVVATDVGDNKHLVINGSSGFLTPVKDIEEISDKLLCLVLNSNLCLNMGRVGYDNLVNNFTEKSFTDKYLKLIDRLTNEEKV